MTSKRIHRDMKNWEREREREREAIHVTIAFIQISKVKIVKIIFNIYYVTKKISRWLTKLLIEKEILLEFEYKNWINNFVF